MSNIYKFWNETMLSMAYPQMIIRGTDNASSRFVSMKSVNKDGEIRLNTLPPGTRAFTDYHQWKQEAKGIGHRACKMVTRKGNLTYIILP